jgi:hypothetical protein
MKLSFESFTLEPVIYRIDPWGHYQNWSFLPLGKKISHGTIKRPRHPYRLALPRNKGKRSLNLPHNFWVARV